MVCNCDRTPVTRLPRILTRFQYQGGHVGKPTGRVNLTEQHDVEENRQHTCKVRIHHKSPLSNTVQTWNGPRRPTPNLPEKLINTKHARLDTLIYCSRPKLIQLKGTWSSSELLVEVHTTRRRCGSPSLLTVQLVKIVLDDQLGQAGGVLL